MKFNKTKIDKDLKNLYFAAIPLLCLAKMHSIVFNLEPKLGYQIEDFVRKLDNFYKSVVTTLLGEVMKKCMNAAID